MYKINEFALLSGLSIQTLRYYDKEKILVPSYRGTENNYRYYNEEDYEKSKLIVLLKKYNFSILEIKEIVSRFNDITELPYIIQEKKKKIQENILRQQQILEEMGKVNIRDTLFPQIEYQIEKVTIPEIYIVFKSVKGNCSHAKEEISSIVKEACNYLIGSPFLQYNSLDYTEDMELLYGVEVKDMFQTKKFSCKRLSSFQGISVTHYGNYETLHLAYKALFDYVEKMNIRLRPPVREIYRKSPSAIFNGNENLYITEIQIGIE